VKKIYFLVLLSTVTAISFGQATTQKTVSEQDKKKQERKDKMNQMIKEEEEGAMIYSKQSAFGFKMNTDGWGVSYEHGKYKTIKKTNVWWLEFGERKSHKEEKITTGQDIGGGFILVGNPYIYGKQNNFCLASTPFNCFNSQSFNNEYLDTNGSTSNQSENSKIYYVAI